MARHYEHTETRRRQVAEAALLTIAEDGVSGFTTRAVAGRVGISDGTLFRHFGSKQEIVIEAMKLLEAGIDESLVVSADPAADLEGFFRHRAAFVGASGSVGRLIFSEALVHLAGEQGLERLESWRRKSVGYLMGRIGALHQAGQLRDDLDVFAMGMLLQGALLTFAMQASLGRAGTPQDLQVRIDHGWNAMRIVLFKPKFSST